MSAAGRRVPLQFHRGPGFRSHYVSSYWRGLGISVCGKVSDRAGLGYAPDAVRVGSPKLPTCRACLRYAKARPVLVATVAAP